MSGTLNAAAPLARLQEAIARKKIRVPELFVDFDRLRTGLVTRAQFER